MATAGSKEARQLEQAKRMFDKAYKEISKTTTGEAVADENRKHDSDILLGYGQTESGENPCILYCFKTNNRTGRIG